MSKFEDFKAKLRNETRKYLKLYTPSKEQVRYYKKLKKQGVEIGRNVRRGNFHNAFQDRLVEMASEYDVIGKKEHSVPSGFIDVLWETKSGREFIAIELDTKNNEKSIRKLIECNAKYCIWITTATNFDMEDYSHFGEIKLDKVITDKNKEIHFIVV